MSDDPTSSILGTPPYSEYRTAGGFVFVSGHLGIKDGALVPGGIAEETEQAICNIQAVLCANGADLKHVVKAVVFLTSVTEWAEMNAVYASYFTEPYPARSAVGSELPFGARVEIEVIAYVP